MASEAPEPGAADPLSLSGVVPPVVTAFDADEAVDLEATAAHARFVVEHGCHGVVALGTNGEFPLLAPDERAAVVEAVATEIDEVPVVAGVGAPSTHQTIAGARRAEADGADGLMVVTPYYYPLDDRAAVEHYRRVVDAVDLPVYVYQIPKRTGNQLSLDAFAAIAAIDGVAGIKDSSGDVAWLGEAIATAPELTYLAGSDALVRAGLDLGCAGAVSAVANAVPELVVDLYEAYDAGDEARARERQETLYRVRRALKRGPHMAGVKTALSLRDLDFDVGGLRRPLRRMSDDDRAELERTLRDVGVL